MGEYVDLPPKPTKLDGKQWWLSWYAPAGEGWALWFPWWVSGYDPEDRDIIVAAVIADSEDEAKQVIYDAYDKTPDSLEWRFVNELEEGRSAFSDRFRRAEWMVWP